MTVDEELADLQMQRALAADMVKELLFKMKGTPARMPSESALGDLGLAITACEKTIERLDREIDLVRSR